MEKCERRCNSEETQGKTEGKLNLVVKKNVTNHL